MSEDNSDKLMSIYQTAEGYSAGLWEDEEAVLEHEADRKEQLPRAKAAYEQLYSKLTPYKQVSCPVDGKYVVVRKSSDRIRMAITADPGIDLGGYLPKFDIISDWQEIIFKENNHVPVAQTIFHWDKDTLDKFKKDSHIYWGIAEETHLNDKELPPEKLKTETESLARTIPIPPKLLAE